MLTEEEIEQAVVFLQPFLRSRTPGTGSLSAGDNALASLLDPAIPAHAAYNRQRFFALEALVADSVGSKDPVADSDGIAAVAARIHDKRPKFREPLSPDVIASLHAGLVRHKAAHHRYPGQIPPPTNVGQRTDEPQLSADGAAIMGVPQAKRMRHLADARANEALLDRIVPDGAFYNPLRRFIVEETLRSGQHVADWQQRDRRNAGKSGFTPNPAHHAKMATMDKLHHEISDWRNHLNRLQAGERPIEPAQAVLLAQCLDDYHNSSTSADAEPSAKRARRGDGAATHFTMGQTLAKSLVRVDNTDRPPTPATDRDTRAAADLAAEIAERMDRVIRPNPGNLWFRTFFAETMLMHTDDYAHHGRLVGTNAVFTQPLEERLRRSWGKPSELRELAALVERYKVAWEERSRTASQAARGAKPISSAARPMRRPLRRACKASPADGIATDRQPDGAMIQSPESSRRAQPNILATTTSLPSLETRRRDERHSRDHSSSR